MEKTKIKKIRKRKKRTARWEDLNLPTQNIEIIAQTLKKKIDLEERETKYARHKEVLVLLGMGLFLAVSIVMPGLSSGLSSFINGEGDESAKEWKKFNPSYLAKTLRRLEEQKLVDIDKEGKYWMVKITDRGRKKILKYALEELEIKKPRVWDGRWYFVTYDIPKGLDWLRDTVRQTLVDLGFYRFHESLYIHAYPCLDEIEFIREYLGAGKYIKVLVVDRIENDFVFRDFFGV